MTPVTLEEFKKLELRAARVLEVEEIAGADRLWKLTIDLGDEKRQIVAGIKAFYPREVLVGKNVVVIANLEPAVIRGVESRGMLLAAKSEGELTVLTLDKPLPPGSPIA